MFKSQLLILSLLLWTLELQAQEMPLPERGICAHRGAMDTHPENTIAAFNEAISLGVQMIEFDVRMTKDQQLVILHDETVDRTTNGNGRIDNLTLQEVQALDAGSWKSDEYKGEKIPTFKEALAVMPKNIWLNVHLKGGKELGIKTAEMLINEGHFHHAFIACGLEAAVGVQMISKELLICNMERQSEDQAYISGTIANGSSFIQLYKTPVGPAVETYCKQLKEHDVRINYCCTDDPLVMKTLFQSGVDFILVNQPGKMLKAVKEMGFDFGNP